MQPATVRLSVSSVIAAILAPALAGCLGLSAEATPSADPPAVDVVQDRPTPSAGVVATGRASAPDLAATTAAPPRLVPGEWWRIRFTSNLLGETPELVRVVADVQDEGYVVGMPHAAWHKEAIAYHAPGFGDIGFDLSWDLHDGRFVPLRFPLLEGATWNTSFAGEKLVATVERADAHTATVRFDPPPREPDPLGPVYRAVAPFELKEGVRLVYDARQHEIVWFESPIGTWEVVEHGYGFEGWVTVPRGGKHVLDYGQFLAATPGEPLLTRGLAIDGGYNRITLMHAVIALSPGAYRIRAVTPNGTELVTEVVGERGFFVKFHESADVDGMWTLEDVVAGAGFTYSMGLAYHQYDIRLPDGARRADHSHPVIR